MNNIVHVNNQLERLPNNLGFITSSITLNRLTNSIISSLYYYHNELFTPLKDCKEFNNYNDLLAHINTIKESLVLVDDEQL